MASTTHKTHATHTTHTAPAAAVGSPLELFTRQVFARIIANVAVTTHDLELSVAQLATLYMIDQRGTIRLNVVAKELARSVAAMSRMVDGLAKKKLVERTIDPSDRRARAITLTARGRKFIETTSVSRVQTIGDVVKTLPAGTFQMMAAAVSKSSK